MIITQRIGVKRKPEHIAQRPMCLQCKKGKYKRDFRLRSGKTSPICRDCRKSKKAAKSEIYGVKPKQKSFFDFRIGIFTVLKRRFLRKKEVTKLAELKARDYATKLTNLPGQIATILGKTYVVQGDDATLSDDQALIRIRDLIDDFEPKLIARNLKKRLP